MSSPFPFEPVLSAPIVTLVFAALLVASMLVKLWLDSRQIRHVARHRDQVPAAFASVVTLESHQKAADYTLAKLRLGLWSTALSTATVVGWTLLGGLLSFWLLEKFELYRHAHHHEGDGHDHHHHFDAQQAGRGGLSILVGDGIHNFCDGVIIAAAFLADPTLGWVTAAAVVAHEIPQEAGDYIVLLNAGFSRGKALLYNVLSGLAAVAGGIAGFYLVEPWSQALPFLLVVASSSFIYVAVADLLPQLQQRLSWRDTLSQLLWLGAGLGLVMVARAFLEGTHAH